MTTERTRRPNGRSSTDSVRLRAVHAQEPGPTVSREVAASAEDVWSVLADGWTYGGWVFGTANIIDVDSRWPTAYATFRFSFGIWPFLLKDVTRVERSVRNRELVLNARAWPAGSSHVHISLQPRSRTRCVIWLTEDVVSGPARLIPGFLRHLLLAPKNRETLHRLALIAEGRASRGPS
ncbi:MAG TPA: SRPBCC family protein [Propionibacteriaceae bacterium]|nr:SRPBCC family protein [Propionibacteriaceae bacterium]